MKHKQKRKVYTQAHKKSAVLISNGHIFLNGTEAFINNTNEEVKNQLLSGNSELNYLIGRCKLLHL